MHYCLSQTQKNKLQIVTYSFENNKHYIKMGCLSSQPDAKSKSIYAVATLPIATSTAIIHNTTVTSKPVATVPPATSTKIIENEAIGTYATSLISKAYEQALQPLVLEFLADLPNSLIGAGSSSTTADNRIQKQMSTFKDVLPCQASNAIFVRVSSTKMYSMNALISGSTYTPYANGLYHFQLFCDSNFPNSPPKMQILTGKGKIRFNPNLYITGYICLSLLGTWSGSNCEVWSSSKSNLSQIFISIQSLIMSNDIFFNEPGYQQMKGTAQGEKYNRGYGMVVKLANIRYAMIEMIKKPPIGFEEVVRKHFLLKKEEILEQCQRWLKEKDLPILLPAQNPGYENNIRDNGFGKLLEKEIEELKKAFATLKEQP